MPLSHFNKFLSILLLISTIFSVGCQEKSLTLEPKKELLIYCGITMARPISEIAKQFEQTKNCRIKIIQGGSGNLYRSIKVNRAGDLFLPGSESYMERCRTEKLVSERVQVGVNQATLVVAKGNPLGISASLDNLLNHDIRIVLGAAESGSIGKETKRILSQAGIYSEALNRSLFLTNDSKGLSEAIRAGKADLTVNWLATSYWDDNRDAIDAIPLPSSIAPPHNLLLGLLEFSKTPQLAKEFMLLASSPEGQAIFNRYGLTPKAP